MGILKLSQSYPPSVKVGSSSVSKIMEGTTQVWPATNYYDCGYGCQYYLSPPACSVCAPTTRNILTGVYISADTYPTKLDYYVTLSNNTSPTTINYKLRLQNITRSSGWVNSGTLAVTGYSIEKPFSGTINVAVTNVLGDTFGAELSDDNGSTWVAVLVTTEALILNYGD